MTSRAFSINHINNKTMATPLFHVHQNVHIRKIGAMSIGGAKLNFSAGYWSVSDPIPVEAIEVREDEPYYRLEGKKQWYKESDLCGTMDFRHQRLNRGFPVYMDYGEEGFIVKFIREGNEKIAYQKAEDGTVVRKLFAPNGDTLILDAWHLGIEIPEDMYKSYGKTWQ